MRAAAAANPASEPVANPRRAHDKADHVEARDLEARDLEVSHLEADHGATSHGDTGRNADHDQQVAERYPQSHADGQPIPVSYPDQGHY